MDEDEIRAHMKAIRKALARGDDEPPAKPMLALLEGFLVNVSRIAKAADPKA